MFFYRREISGLAIYSYLIGDDESKRCAIIDPVRDIAPYIDAAADAGYTITDIFETHVHADYLSGAMELKRILGESVTIHCSAMGGERWTPRYVDNPIHDGDTVTVGSLTLRAYHTPGHTPEHLVWVIDASPPLLFSGDLLFAGSVGRPDLLGDEMQRQLSQQLYHSLFTTLLQLPDAARLYPGHGAGSLCGKMIQAAPPTTLSDERRSNPMLQAEPEEQWVDRLIEGMPPIPSYFPRMKELNLDGAPPIGTLMPSSLTPRELIEAIIAGALLLDTRSSHAFAAGHIAGAIHIPPNTSMATRVGTLIPPEMPLCLVTDAPIEETIQLKRIGYDIITGYLKGGTTAWEAAGHPLTTLPQITAKQLKEEAFQVIDVRSTSEWNRDHVPGAHHIPLEDVAAAPMPDNDATIALLCESGARAATAASLLMRRGIANVAVVTGGMKQLRQL